MSWHDYFLFDTEQMCSYMEFTLKLSAALHILSLFVASSFSVGATVTKISRTLRTCSTDLIERVPTAVPSWILTDLWQQFEAQLKHTCRVTLPSCSSGWAPFNHPVPCVPHLLEGTHEVGIVVPASPWKRNHAGPRVLSQRKGVLSWGLNGVVSFTVNVQYFGIFYGWRLIFSPYS